MSLDYMLVEKAARAARAWQGSGQPRAGAEAREIVADLRVQMQADRFPNERDRSDLDRAAALLQSEAGARAADELLQALSKRIYTRTQVDWSKDRPGER